MTDGGTPTAEGHCQPTGTSLGTAAGNARPPASPPQPAISAPSHENR
jgi:hypothetical protein